MRLHQDIKLNVTAIIVHLASSKQYDRLHPCPFLQVMVKASMFTHFLNASSAIPIGCFRQNPPSVPQLSPLTYVACQTALNKIPVRGKAHAPLTFSHSASAGYIVPHTWSNENCVVIIDVLGDDVEETTTFSVILSKVFDIALKCVINPPHFGGKSRVGERGMLGVAIIESPPGMLL